MASPIFCIICGANISERRMPRSEWLGQVRFVHHDTSPAPHPLLETQSTPMITPQGRITRPRDPTPELLDINTNTHHPLPSRLLGNRTSRLRPTSACYPLHISCYKILIAVVQKLHPRSHNSLLTSINSSGDDESTLSPLFTTALYNILSHTSHDRHSVWWPHDYGDIAEYQATMRQWRSLPSPLAYVESDPGLVPDAREMYRTWVLEEFPRRVFVDAEMGMEMDIGVGMTFGSVSESKRGGGGGVIDTGKKRGRRIKSYASIPDLWGGLPMEVVVLILQHLSGEDILRLEEVESRKRIQVPDLIWKRMFDTRSEFGFVGVEGYGSGDTSVSADIVIPEGIEEWVPEESWYTLYRLSRGLGGDVYALRNKKRIWDLCTMLVDTISDVANSVKVIGVSEEEDTIKVGELSKDQGLVVQALLQETQSYGPAFIEGSKTLKRGRLGEFIATGVYVSYIGSGRMRYVGGLRFVPGGQEIGLVNVADEIFVDLGGAEKALWAAATKYGIVGFVTTEDLEADECSAWKGSNALYKAAVTRRYLRPGPDGTLVSGVFAGIEISRMTELGIWSPNITSRRNLDPEERLIQENLWSPSFPVRSSLDQITLNSDCYYEFLPPLSSKTGQLESNETNSLDNLFGWRWKVQFAPIEHIYFGSETITRFTCWSEGYRDIRGIGVFTKERGEEPHLLGQRLGAATDLFINGVGGEYVSHMEILSSRVNGPMVGIQVYTSFGRKFSLNLPAFGGKKVKASLVPAQNQRVTGFYSRFGGPHDDRFILSLGIISSGAPLRPIYPAISKQAENPELIPYFSNWSSPGSPREQFRVGREGHFASSVSLKNVKSIQFYAKTTLEFRLVGLSFNYHPNYPSSGSVACSSSQVATFGGDNPKILGQISQSDTSGMVEPDLLEGEQITSIEIYRKEPMIRPPMRLFMIIGIKFVTSLGREILVGYSNNASYEKTLAIREQDFLLWEYTEWYDSITTVVEQNSRMRIQDLLNPEIRGQYDDMDEDIPAPWDYMQP